MFREHRTPWDLPSIRRYFRMHNGRTSRQFFLGYTVYLSCCPGLIKFIFQVVKMEINIKIKLVKVPCASIQRHATVGMLTTIFLDFYHYPAPGFPTKNSIDVCISQFFQADLFSYLVKFVTNVPVI